MILSVPLMPGGGEAARRRAAILAPTAAAACGLAAGAALAYFLDPAAGRRRRHTARDRALSRARRGERHAHARARRAEAHAAGVARRTLNARRHHAEPVDDVALAHRVESQLYRRAGAAKGHISVNAEEGVVFLRGTLDREEDIAAREAMAAAAISMAWRRRQSSTIRLARQRRRAGPSFSARLSAATSPAAPGDHHAAARADRSLEACARGGGARSLIGRAGSGDVS